MKQNYTGSPFRDATNDMTLLSSSLKSAAHSSKSVKIINWGERKTACKVLGNHLSISGAGKDGAIVFVITRRHKVPSHWPSRKEGENTRSPEIKGLKEIKLNSFEHILTTICKLRSKTKKLIICNIQL